MARADKGGAGLARHQSPSLGIVGSVFAALFVAGVVAPADGPVAAGVVASALREVDERGSGWDLDAAVNLWWRRF